jgi:hypothetical protein
MKTTVISDYVASILVHFAMHGNAHRIGGADDEVYDTMAALLAEVDHGDTTRRFLVRAHLGNYALWLGGLLSRSRGRGGAGAEVLISSITTRWASVATLAAQHRLAKERHGGLFEATAERFWRIRAALNQVSDRFLFPGRESANRLLRQVSADARWRLTS